MTERIGLHRLPISMLLVLASVTAVPAQQPVADSRPFAPVGAAAATIVGAVISDVGQSGVRRVMVTASSETVSRSVVTADDGTFSIGDLPPGGYRIAASKAGYLDAEYGASRPARVGITVSLSEGQRIEGVVIRMLQASAIGGRLVDVRGHPAQGVQVTAFRTLPGDLIAAKSYSATSDDRGRYRVFGLPPGEYIVCGLPPFSILAGGYPSLAIADFDATVAALKNPSASARPVPSLVSLVPIFFPDAFNVARASRISVGQGESREGIDMTILAARAATVNGTVVLPPDFGPPVVSMAPIGPDLPMPPSQGPQLHVSRVSDGQFDFRFTGVASGGYLISARGFSNGAAGMREGWSTTEIQVGDDDIKGVTLVMRPTMEVRGRVAIVGTTTLPVDLSALRVLATNPADGVLRRRILSGMAPATTTLPPTPVGSDGSFRIGGLMPGQYQLNVTGLPNGWLVQSATMDDRDVLDTLLPIGPDNPYGTLAITISNQRSSIVGKLQVPLGQEPFGYYVVVFPADATLRRAPSRRVTIARPSTVGDFHINDLPPGEYILGALVDFEQDDLWNPAFFPPLEALGIQITLGQGEQKRQDIRIGR